MKQKEIPLPYKIIMGKAWQYSFMGEVPIKEFRKILRHTFRFGKQNVNNILTEMKGLEIININKSSVKLNWYSKSIGIEWKPKSLKLGVRSTD